MMNKLIGFAATAASAVALSLTFSAPASAAIVFADVNKLTCDIYDLSAGGCKFTYDSEQEVQQFSGLQAILAAYNALRNPDLDPPDYLGKIDVDGSGVFTTTDFVLPYDPNLNITTTQNGQIWEITNLPFDVSYFTVKAGSKQILLFGIDPGASQFDARNVSLTVGNKGNIAAISHISFYGTSVPEPATWALMILGFGSAGAMLRRRRTAAA